MEKTHEERIAEMEHRVEEQAAEIESLDDDVSALFNELLSVSKGKMKPQKEPS